jgi:serralysin
VSDGIGGSKIDILQFHSGNTAAAISNGSDFSAWQLSGTPGSADGSSDGAPNYSDVVSTPTAIAGILTNAPPATAVSADGLGSVVTTADVAGNPNNFENAPVAAGSPVSGLRWDGSVVPDPIVPPTIDPHGHWNGTITSGFSTAANDTFVFAPIGGNAVNGEFHSGNDSIALDHVLFSDFAAIQSPAEQVGADAVFSQDNHDAITLKNTPLGSLHDSDFALV